jgi:hypothetical protein
MDKPPVDTNRIDDAVLALLFYGAWKEKGFPDPILRSWKGFDWDAMNRLYEKDLIYNSGRQGQVGVAHGRGRKARRGAVR